MRVDLTFLFCAFVLSSLVAAAVGASFGHAITFGQLGFAATLMYVLIRR